jgi:hypothetical protein
MTGGSEVKVPSPTGVDRAALRQRVVDSMMQEALDQLQSAIPTGDFILTSTLSITKVLDETSFPPAGVPGNELELSMQIRVKGLAIEGEVLRDFVIPIMDSYTPAGYFPYGESLEISQLNLPKLREDGTAEWTIRATRQVQADLQPSQIVGQVTGKPIRRAIQKLSSMLPLANEPVVHLTPGWWPWLPLIAMRIQAVQVDSQ